MCLNTLPHVPNPPTVRPFITASNLYLNARGSCVDYININVRSSDRGCIIWCTNIFHYFMFLACFLAHPSQVRVGGQARATLIMCVVHLLC